MPNNATDVSLQRAEIEQQTCSIQNTNSRLTLHSANIVQCMVLWRLWFQSKAYPKKFFPLQEGPVAPSSTFQGFCQKIIPF